MNQHTPQEWADWTGCYVAQDKGGSFYMFPDKPDMCTDGALWRSDDFFVCIPEELVDIPADHHWTTLYEPQRVVTHETTHEKRMKNAPHQSEVFIHQEYKVIPAQASGSLNVKVNQLLAEGWKLYGSPFSRQFDIYQAMVRGV